MAAKLIVALACLALCNATPVLNGFIFRSGRGYSVGQGYTNNVGGKATGSATINGGVIKAYGSASSADQTPLRESDEYGVPGEVLAKAEVYDTPQAYGAAKAVAQAQNTPTYYTVPAPANIVSYQQNIETPAVIRYEYPGAVANTAAKSQGYGSASSKSETGSGLTSATSQTNGGYASSAANNAANLAVVSTNAQGVASSQANVNSPQSVVISQGKGWKFGTAYTVPTPGQAHVSSQANGGVAKSTAHTGGVVTTANAQGYGSANANANLPGAYINSAANTNGFGYGAARYTEGNQYGSAQSTINNGLGVVKTAANSNGYGNADSHADINEQGSLSSVSNSNGRGTAASSANSAPTYVSLRGDGLPYMYSPRSSVNTQTAGHGSASANTQGLNTGYRVVNSVANSYGYGTAQANASA